MSLARNFRSWTIFIRLKVFHLNSVNRIDSIHVNVVIHIVFINFCPNINNVAELKILLNSLFLADLAFLAKAVLVTLVTIVPHVWLGALIVGLMEIYLR